MNQVEALHQLFDELRRAYRLHEFVETGTHMGTTALWAADHFEKVWTIELHAGYFHAAQAKFLQAKKTNINHWLGDSRDCLSQVLDNVLGKALIFLDAHWGPDLEYARPTLGECPIGEELVTIAKAKDYHVIVIHDKHLFAGNIPEGHDPAQWPTVADFLDFAADYEYRILVFDHCDSLVLVPLFISEHYSHE